MVEVTPVRFRVGEGRQAIYIEDRGSDRWAVTQAGECLNSSGDWEVEPHPSSRDEAFLDRCRYTFDEAKRRAIEAFEAGNF